MQGTLEASLEKASWSGEPLVGGRWTSCNEPQTCWWGWRGQLTLQLPSTQMSRLPGSQGVPSTTASLCL